MPREHRFLGNGVMCLSFDRCSFLFCFPHPCVPLLSSRNWMDAGPARPGMLCSFPLMGLLTGRIFWHPRGCCRPEHYLALMGTVPLVYMSEYGMISALLAAALFIRGAGLGAIGIPSVTAACASVKGEICRWRRLLSTSFNGSGGLDSDHPLRDLSRMWALKAVSIDAVQCLCIHRNLLAALAGSGSLYVSSLSCFRPPLRPLREAGAAEEGTSRGASVELMSE